MIQIDYQNALSDKIGLKDGINKRIFSNFLQKHGSLVKKVFKEKNKTGYDFLNLPDDLALIRKIKKFVKDQKKNKWENIVVLGIGGSALGGIAIKEALLGPLHDVSAKPKLFFLDNIDPDYISQMFSAINLKKTLFVVISKSGRTTEPMALFDIVRQRLTALSGGTKNYKKHLVFITDPTKGILRKIGKTCPGPRSGKEKITMFAVPQKIGGRFSALSSVGLVPAALAGIDIEELLKGAKSMREIIKKTPSKENLALILATLQFLLDREKKKVMTIMMPYSNPLFKIGDWYRQLLAESIGKNKTTGPTPINALGTTDQHSQLQLYNNGPNNKWFIFLRVLKYKQDFKLSTHLPKDLEFLNQKTLSQIIHAAHFGTAESLAKNKRPNITIDIKKINPETIGALLMLFEFQVALLGLLYKVDTFNQPGVEEGKRITKQLLSK